MDVFDRRARLPGYGFSLYLQRAYDDLRAEIAGLNRQRLAVRSYRPGPTRSRAERDLRIREITLRHNHDVLYRAIRRHNARAPRHLQIDVG